MVLASKVSYFIITQNLKTCISNSLQHRRCIQPTELDLNRHHINPLPPSPRPTGQDTPPTLQELDVPLRPVDLRHPQQLPRSRAGMELLQSQIRRRQLCQLLRRAACHAHHVCGVEAHQEDQDCQAE